MDDEYKKYSSARNARLKRISEMVNIDVQSAPSPKVFGIRAETIEMAWLLTEVVRLQEVIDTTYKILQNTSKPTEKIEYIKHIIKNSY